MLDLRIPSGLFFTIVGFILIAMGILNPGLSARMTSANVNLYGGLAMLAFGVILLAFSRRKGQ